MNNYEASEVFEFGRAQDMVLGSKPAFPPEIDTLKGVGYRTNPLPDDIDESDD